jgi:hypothetical protein
MKEDGDYEVGKDEDDAVERFEDEVGGSFRRVKINVTMAPPEPQVANVTVPGEAGTIKLRLRTSNPPAVLVYLHCAVSPTTVEALAEFAKSRQQAGRGRIKPRKDPRRLVTKRFQGKVAQFDRIALSLSRERDDTPGHQLNEWVISINQAQLAQCVVEGGGDDRNGLGIECFVFE